MPTATKNDIIDLSSENKTEELAKKISKKLKPGNIVFLNGEMGVGKTTFVRYLVNELQKENQSQMTEVTSPTFNLMNEYQVDTLKIKHFDLFRLNSQAETKDLDLFEENENCISLIEWPQIIKKKPKNLIELFFRYEEDHQKRSVQIKGLSMKSFNE